MENCKHTRKVTRGWENMNTFIKQKKYLSLLSNHSKRRTYVSEDCNWNTIETSENAKIRIQVLSFTPYVRVQLITYPSWAVVPQYKTLGYFRQEKDGISAVMYNESDIVGYLAQQVLENKQKMRGTL